MRLIWEFLRRSFKRQLVYRAATIAGLLTNIFFGIIRAAVLIALYGTKSEVSDLTIQSAITYAGLTQAMIGFLALFSWYDLMMTIYSGNVAMDLLKPMQYYYYWLAQDFGRAIGQFLLRGLPLMFLFALLFDITIPNTIIQWWAIFCALVLAWLVSFTWRFLANLSAFWSPNSLGIIRFVFIMAWSLSGFFMPLRFYPEWFQKICFLTPFPYSVNTIVEVYLGKLNGGEILNALFMQAIWAVGLIILGQLILRFGIKRLVILGG